MNIKINGKNRLINKELKLAELIKSEVNSSEPKGIAVALNFSIIPKQKWDEIILNENDEIEIVHAVQGG